MIIIQNLQIQRYNDEKTNKNDENKGKNEEEENSVLFMPSTNGNIQLNKNQKINDMNMSDLNKIKEVETFKLFL